MRRSWYLSAAVGCTIVVAVLSLYPDAEVISSRAYVEPDHLLAYSILTLFWCLADRGPTVAILPGIIAYGLVLELLQIGVPGRSFEWMDVVANTIGVCVGWGSLLIGRKLVRKRSTIVAGR